MIASKCEFRASFEQGLISFFIIILFGEKREKKVPRILITTIILSKTRERKLLGIVENKPPAQ